MSMASSGTKKKKKKLKQSGVLDQTHPASFQKNERGNKNSSLTDSAQHHVEVTSITKATTDDDLVGSHYLDPTKPSIFGGLHRLFKNSKTPRKKPWVG